LRKISRKASLIFNQIVLTIKIILHDKKEASIDRRDLFLANQGICFSFVQTINLDFLKYIKAHEQIAFNEPSL